MDHVLREGLYMDRIRTNWRLGTKDQSYMFIFKVNALRFTLVMARKHERQTGVVMNDLARLGQVWRTYSSRQWKGCCQTNAE